MYWYLRSLPTPSQVDAATYCTHMAIVTLAFSFLGLLIFGVIG